jgi:hypothetical protein
MCRHKDQAHLFNSIKKTYIEKNIGEETTYV